MTYALDTNILIQYLRNNQNVKQRFDDAVMNGDSIVIPKIVDYEIKRGFRLVDAPRKKDAYEILVSSQGYCSIIDMNAECWLRAEIVYEELYRKGFTVGELDILIATICLENNFTLVTNNIKHFDCIGGLVLADWSE